MSGRFGYKVMYDWLVDAPTAPISHAEPFSIITTEMPRFVGDGKTHQEAVLELFAAVEKEKPCDGARLRILWMKRVELLA